MMLAFLSALVTLVFSSCSFTSSISHNDLFEKAVYARWDEEQEVLRSDETGKVLGYEQEIFVIRMNESQPIKLTNNSATHTWKQTREMCLYGQRYNYCENCGIIKMY